MISRSYIFRIVPGAEDDIVAAYRKMIPGCEASPGFVDMILLEGSEGDLGLYQGVSFWESEEALEAYASGALGAANVELMEGLVDGQPQVVRWVAYDLHAREL